MQDLAFGLKKQASGLEATEMQGHLLVVTQVILNPSRPKSGRNINLLLTILIHEQEK